MSLHGHIFLDAENENELQDVRHISEETLGTLDGFVGISGRCRGLLSSFMIHGPADFYADE